MNGKKAFCVCEKEFLLHKEKAFRVMYEFMLRILRESFLIIY